MKKLFIILGSAVALAIVAVLVFVFVVPKPVTDDSPKPAPTTSEESAAPAVPIEDTLEQLLSTEPAVLTDLNEAKDDCSAEAGLSAKGTGPADVETTYDEFSAKAKELTSSDESITLIEDNYAPEVNGKNLNIVYPDKSAILLNFVEGKLTVTLMTTC